MSEVTRLNLADAAVLAAFVFGLTSALAIWLAVREIFGARLADRAVLLYVFCPTAYVLSLAYTEGLFLTAAAGCLFALSRRYWITAALCACAAGTDPDHRRRRHRWLSSSWRSRPRGAGEPGDRPSPP